MKRVILSCILLLLCQCARIQKTGLLFAKGEEITVLDTHKVYHNFHGLLYFVTFERTNGKIEEVNYRRLYFEAQKNKLPMKITFINDVYAE